MRESQYIFSQHIQLLVIGSLLSELVLFLELILPKKSHYHHWCDEIWVFTVSSQEIKDAARQVTNTDVSWDPNFSPDMKKVEWEKVVAIFSQHVQLSLISL